MTKPKFTLLLLLFLGLLGLVYRSRQMDEGLDVNSKLLFDKSKLSSLTEIRLSHPEQDVVLARKSPSKPWQLTEPVKAQASREAVGKLLAALKEVKVYSSLDLSESDRSSKAYGFDSSPFSFSLKGDFPKETWLLGKQTSFSGQRYLLDIENPRIYMVDDGLTLSLIKKAIEFRNRKPLLFNPEEVAVVDIRKGLKINRLVRLESGAWEVKLGKQKLFLDKETIKKRLEAWRDLEAQQIFDNPGVDLSGYGLEPELIFFSLSFQDKSIPPLEIQFAEVVSSEVDAEKKYFFRKNKQGPVYRSKLPSYRDFLQPLHLLRDRTPFSELSGDLITDLKISAKAGESIHLLLKDGVWQTEKGEEISSKKVSKLIAGIQRLKVLTFLGQQGDPLIKVDLDSPVLELEFRIKGVSQSRKVIFGSPVAKGPVTKEQLAKGLASDSGENQAPDYAALKSIDGALTPAVISSGQRSAISKLLKEF